MQTTELSLRRRSIVRWRILRCRRCGLVYVEPRPRADSVRDIYEGDEYGFARSTRSDAYVDGRPHAIRVLRQLEPAVSGRRLLDVGCGTGDFLAVAARSGWSATGVELSSDAADVARGRGLSVATGATAEAGFPPGAFDAVTLLDVIEHLPEPLRELEVIHRLLTPGGVLCVETPNWNSIYRHLLRRRWAALQPRLHLLYFDSQTLEALLVQAGFRVTTTVTEIVALLSPEAVARGLGPSLARSLVHDGLVRLLLRQDIPRLRHALLALGTAARSRRRETSYRQMSQAHDRHFSASPEPTPPHRGLLTRLGRPVDRLFLRLGMGEQLRIVAQKR